MEIMMILILVMLFDTGGSPEEMATERAGKKSGRGGEHKGRVGKKGRNPPRGQSLFKPGGAPEGKRPHRRA